MSCVSLIEPLYYLENVMTGLDKKHLNIWVMVNAIYWMTCINMLYLTFQSHVLLTVSNITFSLWLMGQRVNYQLGRKVKTYYNTVRSKNTSKQKWNIDTNGKGQILRDHLIYPGSRYLIFVVYLCFVERCWFFCPLLLAIVLSVLLRFTDVDYPIWYVDI